MCKSPNQCFLAGHLKKTKIYIHVWKNTEASLCEGCHSVHCRVGPVPFQNEASSARYGTGSNCAAWQSAECCCMSAVLACQGLSACKQESPLSARPCPAPLSSHNQWPFCLRWWMREKCCVSTLVIHTVSLSLSLLLSLLPLLSFSHMLSSWRSTTYTAVRLCSSTCVLLTSAHTRTACACAGLCVLHQLFLASSHRCMICSPSLLEFPFYFVTAHRPCGWRWVLLLLSLSLVGVCVCVLSPGQSEEWVPRL